MDAYVYSFAGAGWRLPGLLRWDVSHGFCSPCDSFEAEFLYEPDMIGVLRSACRFRGEWKGQCVFFGVVDDFELSVGEGGRVCTIHGRGMQALLLDSEAESAEYYAADTEFILRRHVYACGLSDVDAGSYGAVAASLSVGSGESHWSVLSRFAEFCLGLRPRFSPEGRLLLDGADSGRSFVLDDSVAVTSQRYVQDRYGVISQALVKNRANGAAAVTVENPEFSSIGGRSVRVVSVPRRTGFDAMRHTGSYQIKKSGEQFIRCFLTVPQCFAAFPGDRASLRASPLGIAGEFRVWSSRCFADGRGAGTTLELRPL
ncbi:MAG: hypothetical protein IJ705_06310 [Oscillospiraceae bacterium]|nr:hypothetical protein [Oscillospiraceae bacterium]